MTGVTGALWCDDNREYANGPAEVCVCVSCACVWCLFWVCVLGVCFGCLFWVIILDVMFWVCVLGVCFGCLFWVIVLGVCFGVSVLGECFLILCFECECFACVCVFLSGILTVSACLSVFVCVFSKCSLQKRESCSHK